MSYTEVSKTLYEQTLQVRLPGTLKPVYDGIVLNPLTVIILLPIVQKGLYPFLAKNQIAFHSVVRISTGYFILVITLAVVAVNQHLIYNTGPCYDQPLACPASDGGRIPNHISFWVLIPASVLLGLSEIFALVTSPTHLYSNAPQGMETIMQGLFLISEFIADGLGIALSFVNRDPNVIWVFVGLTAVMAFSIVLFWPFFRNQGNLEEGHDDVGNDDDGGAELETGRVIHCDGDEDMGPDPLV